MPDYLNETFDFADPDFPAILDELSLWSARFGMLLLDNLKLVPGIRALDIGCGSGFPLFELAQLHGEGCEFTGVEVWDEALERARWKLNTYKLNNVSLLKVDGHTLPFPDDYFDLIVSNLGVNNFENPLEVLNECARVSRTGARLVLTTNLLGHMQEFYQVYREALTELELTSFLPALAIQEEHRGTKESLCNLVEQTNFKVTRLVESSFNYRFLNAQALLNHFFIRIGFVDGWRTVLPPEERVRVFQTIEQKLNALAAQQGELKLGVPMLYLEAVRN
jgi:ubiquinone/menaquinone biosynthesis C-methylase UbiE